MSCKCKLGLGSFTQCAPASVELREWKPQFLAQNDYLIPVGEEAVTYMNPYLNDAELVEDLSHVEPMDAIAIMNEDRKKESSNSGKFWTAAAVAFLIFK